MARLHEAERRERARQQGRLGQRLGRLKDEYAPAVAHGALHFEGRIWQTLPMLAVKPGELTRRYIAGERANGLVNSILAYKAKFIEAGFPANARIQAEESILYHNRSPDTLRYLLLHLYQNVFAEGAQRTRLSKPTEGRAARGGEEQGQGSVFALRAQSLEGRLRGACRLQGHPGLAGAPGADADGLPGPARRARPPHGDRRPGGRRPAPRRPMSGRARSPGG